MKKIIVFFTAFDHSSKKLLFFQNFTLGIFAAFGLAPIYFIPACFLSFGLFVCILDNIASIKEQSKFSKGINFALANWSFGFGYFLAGLFWLSYALTSMKEIYYWAIPLVLIGFSSFLAIYWGLLGALLSFFWRNNFSRFFALAISIGIAEWLRGHLFTGFPWNAIGYNIMPNAFFMQSSSIVGLYSMNLFAVFIFALSACFIKKTSRRLAASFLFGIFFIHLSVGLYYFYQAKSQKIEPFLKKDGTPYTVRLIQSSVSPKTKFNPDKIYQNFLDQLSLARLPSKIGLSNPDLMIWPETAVPIPLDSYPEILNLLSKAMLPHQISLLGTIRSAQKNGIKKFYNSIEAFDAFKNHLAVSDKVHLVPFGEYVPMKKILKFLGFSAFAYQKSEYSHAKIRYTVTLPNGLTYLPLICYEIIFPSQIHYEGKKPQFIVNVTNDMWYGTSSEPYQHLQQARLQAIEQRLPVLRAANNGISSVIDAYGREIASLPLNQAGIVDSILPLNPGLKKFNPNEVTFLSILLLFLLNAFVFYKIAFKKTFL